MKSSIKGEMVRAAKPLAAVILAASCSTARADDLTVIEAVWTTGVTAGREFIDSLRPNSVTRRPLYFWTRLKGGAASLQELKATGKLPIVHQWIASNTLYDDTDILSIEPDEGRNLTAGSIFDRGGGLTATVDARGEFKWRTWSRKDSLWPGTWIVIVRYADGTPVLCSGVPCHWSIDLR